MDLLGDLGTADQLTAARAENAVLQEKVKHLSFRVKELSIENESLKAEVEIYRREAALPNFSNLALGQGSMDIDSAANNASEDHFVRSGNGVFPQQVDMTLPNLHGTANPLCCSLSPDEVVLATGGADGYLQLLPLGVASDNAETNAKHQRHVRCGAPVISVGFAYSGGSNNNNLLACGCMDGSVFVVVYAMKIGQGLVVLANTKFQHDKHVKHVAWHSSSQLATASADGTVHIHQVTVKTNYCAMQDNDDDDDTEEETTTIQLQKLQTLHLSGAVEALCFWKDELWVYVRDKPYLMAFDVTSPDYPVRKINLNASSAKKIIAAGTTTLEDQHVSFAVLDLQVSPCQQYLACATDASRNIILDEKGHQIRNLYGHTNDAYSNPKVAWSANSQYLLGNTQHSSDLCVWELASSKLVDIEPANSKGHDQTIRDMHASSSSDILITTSFDKLTKVWMAPQPSN